MNLVILLFVCLSFATLFTNSLKGRLSNSIVNFLLMLLCALKNYMAGYMLAFGIFMALAILNVVFMVTLTMMYLDERKGKKKVIQTSNRDKFLSEIEKRYGS